MNIDLSTTKRKGVKTGTVRGPYKPRQPKLGVLGSKKLPYGGSSSSSISAVKQEEIEEFYDAPTELEIETSISPAVIEQKLTEEALSFGDVDDNPYSDYRFTKTKTNSLYDDNLTVIRNRALQQYGSFIKERISRNNSILQRNQSYINRALQKI